MAEAASSQVTIIKESILGFITVMDQEKRAFEHQIREISDNINSQFFSQGASQFTIPQVQKLSNSYRDEFVSFYKNSIYLKLLSIASSSIRTALEYGFVNSGIVQEEWLGAFKQMQDQINNYEGLADQVEKTQLAYDEQTSEISDLRVGATITNTDMQHFEQIMKEKDQIIAEKDQEILNLSEGLARMESQGNTMGASLLENSMTIEELQSVIGERDEQISGLTASVKDSSQTTSEIDSLREHTRKDQLRISELEDLLSSASSDLVDQLQNTLEKTREDLLKTRKDLVEKNEELYTTKLYQDEMDTKARRTYDRLNKLEEENTKFLEETGKATKSIDDLSKKNQSFESENSEIKIQVEELQNRQKIVETELKDAKNKLAGFEGQDTITPEEQQRFHTEITQLQEQIEKFNEVINYFKNIIARDSKFQTLIFLDTLKEEMRIDNLSKGIGLPQETVEKAIIELAESGFARSRKEGRYLYVSRGDQVTPFELQEIAA